MKPIGGYFELADREEGKNYPHKEGVSLNTGRNALEFILQSLGNVRKVYLPYYTCDVVLEPLRRLGISWEYYHINDRLEMVDNIAVAPNEYVIVNNYYGIKDAYISQMAARYGEQIIVDCAQAFFAPVIDGIKSFYSARKFVGVADGGVAYPFKNGLSVDNLSWDDSSSHSEHLLIRKEKGPEAGFAKYREDEEKLNDQPMRRMSSFTEDILLHINYECVIEQRRCNFALLENALGHLNMLNIPHFNTYVCPMAYPLMVENGVDIRKRLIENKVFVPKFWPNDSIPEEMLGPAKLSDTILPLPIDQRYGIDDMDRIIKIINH